MAGLVTLKNSFEKEGDLEHVGSTEYLAELAFSVITIINAEDDGRTIDDLYTNMATTSFTSVRNEADLTRDVRSLPRLVRALPG
jgi:replicative DNA helicase